MVGRKTTIAFALMLLMSWVGPSPARDIGKLVVLPVQDRTGQPDGGKETIERLVSDYFGRSPRVTMLTEDQLNSILGSETGSRLSLVQSVADRMECDAVLILTLERFQQRVGSGLSATDPASLSFNFRLFRAPGKDLVCSGRFDETQQPLSENILDFSQARKRGFKWITVEQMAEKAIQDRFDRCPDLRAQSVNK